MINQTDAQQSLFNILHTSVSTMFKCISMQKFIKYIVQFKSYEHFHLNTSTGQNDAWQSLVTILHTNGWTM